MKSMHPVEILISNKIKSTIDDCEDETASKDTLEEDELEQWFQTEVIDNDTVYVCNLCDEGFDSSDITQKHMNDIHQDEIRSILKDSSSGNEESECNNCGMKTCICEWLSKVNE